MKRAGRPPGGLLHFLFYRAAVGPVKTVLYVGADRERYASGETGAVLWSYGNPDRLQRK